MDMDNYQATKKARIDAWETHVKPYEAAAEKFESAWQSLQESHATLSKKKDKVAQKNGGSDVSEEDVLHINAGGQTVRVARGTLTQLRGTILEALFSGRWEKQLLRDSNGRIFLDVSPIAFKAIVDYLNELKISPIDNLPNPPRVADPEQQVVFDGLLTALGLDKAIPGLSVDSTILVDTSHVSKLREFISDENIKGGLCLLYRASRDGWAPQEFHNRCDDQGPTVTVIQTQNGFIFGGCTDMPWKSSGNYYSSTKSFLFALKCHTIPSPVKMKQNDPSNAIYCARGYGPTFGGGNDLQLISNSGTVNIGYTYRCPEGQTSSTFLTGSNTFQSSEVEVFSVDPSITMRAAPTTKREEISDNLRSLESLSFKDFPQDVAAKLQEEKDTLLEAYDHLHELQESFNKENQVVQLFLTKNETDIVRLDVSGTIMEVKRSTLGHFTNSVFHKQFCDPRWNEKPNKGKKKTSTQPSAWSLQEVLTWAKSIPGISDDTAAKFGDVSGVELLALEREDIRDLGITRPGTIALLMKGIRKLRVDDKDISTTFIEHSDYCFGKVIDQLRLFRMEELGVPKPSPPKIRKTDTERFKRIVEYYFPDKNEASQFFG